MIVIDGSALVVAVADTTGRGGYVRSLLHDGAAAPHLVDVEVGEGVRGLVHRGVIDAAAAKRSLESADHLVVHRYPHRPLRTRAWQLRDGIGFAEGLYVALAELLELPLVTANGQLGAATDPRCAFLLV